MSLVIRFYEAREPEETVWLLNFDAVTEYSRSIKGSVAKHPVDKEGEVSDHFSLKNMEYSLTGIVSHADISVDSSLIKDSYGSPPTNTNFQPNPVLVEGGNNGLLNKLVPDSLGQFIPSKPPKVTLNPLPNEGEDNQIENLRADWSNFVRGKLQESMRFPKTSKISGTSKATITYFPLIAEIYRFDRNGVITEDIVRDLILTSVEEKENAESSGALFLNLTLEVTRFADIESETVSASKVSSDMSAKVAKTEELGNTTKVEGKDVGLDGDGGDGGIERDSSQAYKLTEGARETTAKVTKKSGQAISEFLESWSGGWGE